jgi:hypothetical protein
MGQAFPSRTVGPGCQRYQAVGLAQSSSIRSSCIHHAARLMGVIGLVETVKLRGHRLDGGLVRRNAMPDHHRITEGGGERAGLARSGFDHHQAGIGVGRRRSFFGAGRHGRNEVNQMLDNPCREGTVYAFGKGCCCLNPGEV